MKDVIVGKYISGNSIVHKMDPRLKLAINIAFIALVFIARNLILLSSMLSISILFFLLSGLKKRMLLRMMKPVLYMGVFLFLINAFLIKDGFSMLPNDSTGLIDYKSSGDGFFWENISSWKLTISDKVVFQTIFIMIRIYIMIIITTLLTSTTRPMALVKAIEDFLSPLKLLMIPTHIIAMIISIALRFIPTLLDEAQRIMKAQASRGVDFKNGNIKSKSKAMITLIIPLFVSAFSKAEDLANAMETRGYSPYEKRTRYRNYPIKFSDVFIALLIIALIILFVLIVKSVIPLPFWWV